MKRAIVFSVLVPIVGCLAPVAPPGGMGGGDAGPAVTCGSAPHLSGKLVMEPDGTETCLPGACDIGWADCDGNPENGCEADLSKPEHCGECGIVCGAGQKCEVSQGIGYCLASVADAGTDSGSPLVPDAG